MSRLGLCILLAAASVFGQQPTHDRESWREIAKHHYEVPDGESASALAHELSGLLGSADSELRDDLAYSILARWIHRGKLDSTDLRKLADEWTANLKEGIGETGTNSVLKRSFSALCLASIAERDVKASFLGADRYHELVRASLDYLRTERDLRGYDAKIGWIHATAHTSDLLQALAGNSLLTSEEESQIMNGIAARLTSAPDVYTQGEQDRMAQAVLAVIRREDFKAELLDTWFARVQEEDRKTWAEPVSVQSLARYQNHTYALQALVVRLELEAESPKIVGFRQRVLAILKTR